MFIFTQCDLLGCKVDWLWGIGLQSYYMSFPIPKSTSCSILKSGDCQDFQAYLYLSNHEIWVAQIDSNTEFVYDYKKLGIWLGLLCTKTSG